MCDSFIVYRSFYESICEFDDKTRLEFYDTLMKYGLDGIELPAKGVAKAIFTAVKPQIDANAKRRSNGNLGGRPKKEPLVFKENNHGFLDEENNGFDFKKPNDNDNDNDNVNENVDANANANVFPSDTKKEEAIASKKEIVDALVAKWNSYGDRGRIPTIRSVSRDGKTWKSVLARVQDNGIDTVVEVMGKVFASDYLRGFKTDWCAKFDWMMLPSNFEKIANGNYDNTSGVQKQSSVLNAWMERYGEA